LGTAKGTEISTTETTIMNAATRTFLIVALLAGASGAALAQALAPAPLLAPASPPTLAAPPAPVPAAPVPAAASAPLSAAQSAAEQRIAGLQSQLAITQAQATQWYAFAQVMRDNAQSSDALFRQRAASVASMDASANLQSYAQVSRAYAEGNEKLAVAFQALYASFSDPQKKAADTLFRQQAAKAVPPAAARR
jgi:protein CpxP